MSGIVLCLNEVDNMQNEHAVVCPYCKSETVRRWGSGTRNVYDTKPINAVIFRYYCVDCSRTFRYYPHGVDRSQLSRRIRRLAALLWLMDVSTRDVEEIFENLGVSINRMTVWREGQKLIDELSRKKLLTPDTHYKICRSNLNDSDSNYDLTFSISLDSSTIAMLGMIDSADYERVVNWLRKVLAGQEIDVLSLSEFDFSSAELLHLPV